MQFSESSNLVGDPRRALSFACTLLATNGFEIEHRDQLRVEFSGPGMNSTRQNPLLGASHIVFEASGDQLSISADLGGVESIRRFMLRFPLTLGLGLGCGFAILSLLLLSGFNLFGPAVRVPFAVRWLVPLACLLAGLLPVTPWFFLAPWMARRLETKTEQALQTLLGNAAKAA